MPFLPSSSSTAMEGIGLGDMAPVHRKLIMAWPSAEKEHAQRMCKYEDVDAQCSEPPSGIQASNGASKRRSKSLTTQLVLPQAAAGSISDMQALVAEALNGAYEQSGEEHEANSSAVQPEALSGSDDQLEQVEPPDSSLAVPVSAQVDTLRSSPAAIERTVDPNVHEACRSCCFNALDELLDSSPPKHSAHEIEDGNMPYDDAQPQEDTPIEHGHDGSGQEHTVQDRGAETAENGDLCSVQSALVDRDGVGDKRKACLGQQQLSRVTTPSEQFYDGASECSVPQLLSPKALMCRTGLGRIHSYRSMSRLLQYVSASLEGQVDA